MLKCRPGRHTPAFILLFLAEGPSYGLNLLNKMEELLLDNKIDSAAIYRSLKDLESKNLVISSWDTSDSGPAKKIYNITEDGLNELSLYKNDILQRIQNLSYFVNKYDDLDSKGVFHNE